MFDGKKSRTDNLKIEWVIFFIDRHDFNLEI